MSLVIMLCLECLYEKKMHCMPCQASPLPEVIWLKDGIPVSKRATISNVEGGSQILIPSSERADSGVYTIVVKNIVGQESFSVEIRVTGTLEFHSIILYTFAVIFEYAFLAYIFTFMIDIFLHYMISLKNYTANSRIVGIISQKYRQTLAVEYTHYTQ